MENTVPKRAFGRAERIDRRAHKVLSSYGQLLSLVTRIKERGLGIVMPRDLWEVIRSIKVEAATALASEDVINLLTSIREAVVLHFGVAFALHLGDEDWGFVLIKDDSLSNVDSLEVNAYSEFRKESMIGNEEVEEFLQQDEESLEEFMQHVAENPDVVLQPSGGSTRKWYSRKKKSSYYVIKKIKQ